MNIFCVLPLLALLLLNACASQQDTAPTRRVKPAHKTVKTAPLPAVAPMKVGLILPLSGARAELGQALLNAAQMAVFDDSGVQIELLPRDSGETPQQALAAFHSLAETGARLVVGPLFAPQVLAVKPEAARRGIPLLALSNDRSVASGGAYVLGFAPEAQISRVTGFACVQSSRRFAALLPGNLYGDAVSNSLRQAVDSCPNASLSLKRYEAGTAQLTRQLEELAAARTQIDTLVLAESPATLRNIAFPPALDGRHIRLLGTGLWAEDNAGQRVPALIGGWYAAPDGGNRQQFLRHYQAAYGEAPPALASLAYDAVALAAALEKNGKKPDNASLTSASGFMGVDGAFRLLPDGTVERSLAVNRIAFGGRDILDPAPATFGKTTH